jgi:hypothetical protein
MWCSLGCGIVFVGEKVLWGEVLFLNNARGNEGRVRRYFCFYLMLPGSEKSTRDSSTGCATDFFFSVLLNVHCYCTSCREWISRSPEFNSAVGLQC